MRKTAISKIDFKELELYSEGVKHKDIKKILGRSSNPAHIMESFFKVLNFGYDGIIPESLQPKYSPEELCKKVFDRTEYSVFEFKNRTIVPKEDLSKGNFRCGCPKLNEELSLDSDIRYLDLSKKTFNSLFGCYNKTGLDEYDGFSSNPFTIRNLINFSASELLRIRRFGPNSLEELEEELAKHGFELNGRKKVLVDVIEDVQTQDYSPLVALNELLEEISENKETAQHACGMEGDFSVGVEDDLEHFLSCVEGVENLDQMTVRVTWLEGWVEVELEPLDYEEYDPNNIIRTTWPRGNFTEFTRCWASIEDWREAMDFAISLVNRYKLPLLVQHDGDLFDGQMFLRPLTAYDASQVQYLDALSGSYVKQEIDNNTNSAWGLFRSDWPISELVGYCTIGYADESNTDMLLLSDVFIKESFRNQGYGSYMVEEAVRWRTSQDKKMVFLQLADIKLSDFYSKIGFSHAPMQEGATAAGVMVCDRRKKENTKDSLLAAVNLLTYEDFEEPDGLDDGVIINICKSDNFAFREMREILIESGIVDPYDDFGFFIEFNEFQGQLDFCLSIGGRSQMCGTDWLPEEGWQEHIEEVYRDLLTKLPRFAWCFLGDGFYSEPRITPGQWLAEYEKSSSSKGKSGHPQTSLTDKIQSARIKASSQKNNHRSSTKDFEL